MTPLEPESFVAPASTIPPIVVPARRSPRQPVAGPRERRLVVLDPRHDRVAHHGRAAMRQAVLAMTPTQPDDAPRLRAVHGADKAGVFWGVLAANGLALALRVRDFATVADARNDAEALFLRADELVAHDVGVPGTGRHSLWLSLDGRVVLVAGQVWRRSSAHADRLVLRALRRRPLWGPLDN